MFRAEFCSELLIFGIGQSLERACVPRALASLDEAANLLARNPGLAAPGRRCHEHVLKLQRGESF